MKNEKILSISVAAYNVEKYIKQNLDSFVNSNVREDIEVIVTDDGSKDSTVEIVKEYQKLYPGIVKLVEQKNAGPGSTVNSGIKHASGKYFRMVDGDDWVNTANLEKYIKFLKENDVDMVATNYVEVYDNTGEEKVQKIENVEFNKVLDFNEIANKVYLEMHNTTFRTKILQENNIVLDNGFYTDVEYLLLPVPYIKKVAFLDISIYMYRLALATQSVNIFSLQKNINMLSIVLERLIKYYEDNKKDLNENVNIYIRSRIGKMVGTKSRVLLSYKTNKDNKIKLKEFFKKIKENSEEIYMDSMKDRIIAILNKSKFILYRPLSIAYKKRIGYYKQLKDKR